MCPFGRACHFRGFPMVRRKWGGGAASPDGSFAVEVLRLDPGDEFTVRMLSEAYSGLLGHWWGGRTEYCLGDGRCPRPMHNARLLWKGYLAAECWAPEQRLWIPVALELTEGAERA